MEPFQLRVWSTFLACGKVTIVLANGRLAKGDSESNRQCNIGNHSGEWESFAGSNCRDFIPHSLYM